MEVKIWIGNLGKRNDGDIEGDWLYLPVEDKEAFEQFLKDKVGIGTTDIFGQPYEEWYIGDIDSELPIPYREYMSVDEIMELSELVRDIEIYTPRFDIGAVHAYFDTHNNDLFEAVDVILNKSYIHYPHLKTWKDFGKYVFTEWDYAVKCPKEFWDVIDYEKFGKEVGANGIITEKSGYFEVKW